MKQLVNIRKGFTIIELIVVLTVVTILSTIGLTTVTSVSDEEYTLRYSDPVIGRINELYSKVILGKQISEDTAYLKLSCDSTTAVKNMYAYSCTSAGVCTQLLFPTSHFVGEVAQKSDQKRGSLLSCKTKNTTGTVSIVNKFFVYIDTVFPYNIYIKTADNNVLSGEGLESAIFSAGYDTFNKDIELTFR